MSPIVLVATALAEPLADPPLGEPWSDPVTREAETMRIAAGLRCPVCQGMSVADSTTEVAVGMKNRTNELLEMGYTQAQIEDHWVGVYTTWVLLEPPAKDNRAIFVLPAVAVLGGGLAAFFLVGRKRETPVAPVRREDDPYRQQVLKELDD